MDFIVKLASGFMNLFTLGGEQFMSWVSGIIPTILMLLVLMNAIIALAGLTNALRVVGKRKEEVRGVFSGAGSAAISITVERITD